MSVGRMPIKEKQGKGKYIKEKDGENSGQTQTHTERE